jgi:hypothetical protein
MLDDRQRDALKRWYSREKLLGQFKDIIDKNEWEDLEEHLQMRCLFPMSRHSELPDYMRNDDGGPLFPTNLNPGHDVEIWRDAIEVGWEVIEEQFGVKHDDIHLSLANEQQADWKAFLESAEKRLAERKAQKKARE